MKTNKVYDCFTYAGEDILDLRLLLLWEKVDYFVIVEALITHTGKHKALLFDSAKYAWANSKIRYIVMSQEDFSECKDEPWSRERLQREYLKKGFEDASPSDIVLISDVDEIISPECIPDSIAEGVFKTFEQLMFYFYCDYLCITEPLWFNARAVRADFAQKNSLNDIRLGAQSVLNVLHEERISDGGWHFSYLGGIKKINEKLERMAEQELNISKHKNQSNQMRSVQLGHDIYNRPFKWGRVLGYELNSSILKNYFEGHPELISPDNVKFMGSALEAVSRYKHRNSFQKVIQRIKMRVWYIQLNLYRVR